MVILQLLLFPFAVLYNLVSGIRNRLYDLGLKPSVKFTIPVVNVGNLTVGGTGKTPMIEHLIRILHPAYTIATLSRGYGRKTKGMRIANERDDASTLGDEPFQFYKKFSQQVIVVVGEDRAYAIPTILHQFPKTNLVLLDDAYQHRSVTPSLNILLTDYHRLFYNDFLLPAGRLRESKMEAKRAHAVVVTKCPQGIGEDEMMKIEKRIRKYTPSPVFFAKIRYGNPVNFGAPEKVVGNNVVLVSGIANHKPLEEYIHSNFNLVKHIVYADHHDYSMANLARLRELVKHNSDICILTTEKDKVKLEAPEFASIIVGIPIFYLPIEIEFIKNGRDFDELVLNAIKDVGDK